MRVLYVASDQTVPGRTGGSIHVLEVARGLAARGHAVHAVVKAAAGAPAREETDGFVLHRVGWTPGHRFFRFRARPAVAAIAAAEPPDVVIERYYNFGGEGVAVAAERSVPSVLEVNSPVVDHPGSAKAMLDALLLRPARRYREWQCRTAAALVAPILDIVPEFAKDRTEIVTWGANVDAFTPERRRDQVRRELGIPEGATAVLFSGSFRPWHGVPVLVEAARRLRARSDVYFLLAGGGAAGPGDGFRGRRLGALPYERMPEVVAAADVGVAPYDTARLGQLRLGFYWSPLKVFEYMASGLPTITVPRPPLTQIVREQKEALYFREGDAAELAARITELADAPERRRQMGRSARERVVAHYSWAVHCAQLERVLNRVTFRRGDS
jgi:glycosyltransferase involved in cell wall biosynthesis